jgi:hypothetical protein
MGWFRSQLRVWAWVAVLALVLQLGLSLGHIHDLSGEHLVAVHTSAAEKASTCASQNVVDSDDDFCAICAMLAMLSGAQIANAPVVPPLFVLAWTERLTSPDPIFRPQARIAFQSRAPPQV